MRGRRRVPKPPTRMRAERMLAWYRTSRRRSAMRTLHGGCGEELSCWIRVARWCRSGVANGSKNGVCLAVEYKTRISINCNRCKSVNCCPRARSKRQGRRRQGGLRFLQLRGLEPPCRLDAASQGLTTRGVGSGVAAARNKRLSPLAASRHSIYIAPSIAFLPDPADYTSMPPSLWGEDRNLDIVPKQKAVEMLKPHVMRWKIRLLPARHALLTLWLRPGL